MNRQATIHTDRTQSHIGARVVSLSLMCAHSIQRAILGLAKVRTPTPERKVQTHSIILPQRQFTVYVS